MNILFHNWTVGLKIKTMRKYGHAFFQQNYQK